LRERRRSLHARIAEVLEKQFPEIVESQPELVARHCTEAGLIENAADFWAKAGRRSLARSALAEAIAQLTRALDQIATLPATPALRREQINLQVALITPLIHVKGHSSPEVRGATERARALIEQAEAIGEPPENPLLLYSVLMGFWITNAVAFNGDAMRTLAAQFLALAEKQGATIPLMIGHSLMAYSLLTTGSPAQSRGHYDHAIAFTILLRIVRSRCYLVRTSERRLCLIGQTPFGSLAIPKPRSQTRTTPSKMRAKLIKQGLCYIR
jgi:hypothetical protein